MTTAFIVEYPELVAAVVWLLGAGLAGLGAYVWHDHRAREKEDADGLKAVFGQAIVKLEQAIGSLNNTVAALRENISARIDAVEDRQSDQEARLATERQRINGVIAVCRERARHCPMFALGEGSAHFNRRMEEASTHAHCRRDDPDPLRDDGSE